METMTINNTEYEILGEHDMRTTPNLAKSIKRILTLRGKRNAYYSHYTRLNGSWYVLAVSGRMVAHS